MRVLRADATHGPSAARLRAAWRLTNAVGGYHESRSQNRALGSDCNFLYSKDLALIPSEKFGLVHETRYLNHAFFKKRNGKTWKNRNCRSY